MNKYIKITVIAITSIILCCGSVSAFDTTEPPTELPEQATEAVAAQTIEHEAICCLLLAIGIPSGCLIAQGFAFWKW